MRERKKRNFFYTCILIMWLLSCSDVREYDLVRDTDFFPLEVGTWWIYDVSETRYSQVQGREDFTYQLKYSVSHSFFGSGGTINYVIQCHKRNNIADTFEYLDTFSARIEMPYAILNRGTVSFINLAFPLIKGKRWNGNAYNTLGGDDICGTNPSFPCDLYEIENINTPYDFHGEQLTKTVEIIQSNNVDKFVKQDVRKEIYAKDIGLVYKESTLIDYCTVGACVGQQQIEKEHTFKQILNTYGNT